MVVLGLLLILIGALAVAGGVLTVTGSAQYLGFEVGQLGLLLIGLAAGVALWWGFEFFKFGTKRSIQHRREQKQLTKLSDQLSKVEAERRSEQGQHGEHAENGTRSEEPRTEA